MEHRRLAPVALQRYLLRAISFRFGSTGGLLTLLALLLHSLYELPDQVAGLPLHLDGLRLIRVVHLQEVLYLPDVGEGSSHELYGTLLLLLLAALLLLLATLLLLLLFRHDISFPAGLRRSLVATTYPVDTETRLAYTPDPAPEGGVYPVVGGGTKITKGLT